MFLQKRMAESRESSGVDKSKTDFLNQVQTTKSEIRIKFLNLRKDLDDQELRALEKVEKIEREILEKFERDSAPLEEISQVRDGIVAGLKSNATNNLLKKSLEMYDTEIKRIKLHSKIDSTFELVLKWKKLDPFTDICEVSSTTFSERIKQALRQQEQQEQQQLQQQQLQQQQQQLQKQRQQQLQKQQQQQLQRERLLKNMY